MANLDGFLNKYPDHKDDPYQRPQYFQPIKKVVNNSGKLFTPHQGPKSTRQTSIINQNIKLKINNQNYKKSDSYSTYNLNALSAY